MVFRLPTIARGCSQAEMGECGLETLSGRLQRVRDPSPGTSNSICLFEALTHATRSRLAYSSLSSITFVNEALKAYVKPFDICDMIIHIDAEDPLYVYGWRLEQERRLWKSHGSGMTDNEVTAFIDGYFPSYELYVDNLRAGDNGMVSNQLRLVLDSSRRVIKVIGM